MTVNPINTKWRVWAMSDDGQLGGTSDLLWEFGPALLHAGSEWFAGYKPLPNSTNGYLVDQFDVGTYEIHFVSPTRFVSVIEGKIWRFGELASS